MFIEVLLVCLLKGSNFFPRGGIFLPIILKWLFVKDFCLNDSIVIIYCMFGNNMDENIELYDEKVFILEIINCQLNENVMTIAICYNDLNVDKSDLFSLSAYLFYLIFLLSMIIICVMDYHPKKCLNTAPLLLKYTTFTISMQNDAWIHCHLFTHDTLQSTSICSYLCPILPIFVVLYLVQWLIHAKAINIKRNIHASSIFSISQIKYRMACVLRSFCGINYVDNCLQCIECWSHYNCTIICLVCLVFKVFMLLDDITTIYFLWNVVLTLSIVLSCMIINQNIFNNIY